MSICFPDWEVEDYSGKMEQFKKPILTVNAVQMSIKKFDIWKVDSLNIWTNFNFFV